MSANTLFLFHADGANGDKPAADDSASSNVLTYSGTAALSTNRFKFGTSSLRAGGASNCITTTPATNFNFGTANFTIEFWCNLVAQGNWWTVAALGDPGAASEAVLFGYHNNIAYGWTLDKNGNNTYLRDGQVATLNQWYHLASVRHGKFWRFYVDGVLQGQLTTLVTLNDVSLSLWSMGEHGSGWTYPANCYMDEIRISDIARWSANFTPATAAYSIGPPPVTAVASSFDGGLKLNLDMDI